MSKWTPGPWVINRPQKSEYVLHEVATVYGTAEDGVGYLYIMGRIPDPCPDEPDWFEMRRADASLIAAAPEMAELLERANSALQTNDDEAATELASEIRALLKRIGGEE